MGEEKPRRDPDTAPPEPLRPPAPEARAAPGGPAPAAAPGLSPATDREPVSQVSRTVSGRMEETLPYGTAEPLEDAPDIPLPLLEPGTCVATRYRVGRLLGQGGFGAVYQAFDEGPLQRPVALKLLSRVSRDGMTPGSPGYTRFLQEIRTAGALSHPNVATVYDAGEWNGRLYMVQELVAGRDLHSAVQASGPLPLERALLLIRQIGDGLSFAHAQGVLHQDIKPGNILLDGEDRVKIVDFGLARSLTGGGVSLPGRLMGTPGYMPPEQLTGGATDARADVFSAACVMMYLLTGALPFAGDTTDEVIQRTLTAPPTPLVTLKPDLPPELDRILARALRKAPDERYPTVHRFVQDLVHHRSFSALKPISHVVPAIRAASLQDDCVLVLGMATPLPGRRHDSLGHILTARLRAQNPWVAETGSLFAVTRELELHQGRDEVVRQLVATWSRLAGDPDPLLSRISKVAWRLIVTTRFDGALERALAAAGREAVSWDLGDPLEATSDRVPVLHLLGTFDRPGTVVLTEEELWERLEQLSQVSDVARSVLATCPQLFVGHDPEDPYFRQLATSLMRPRAGAARGCLLIGEDFSLSSVQWAERRGLDLVEAAVEPVLDDLGAASREPVADRGEALPARPYKRLDYFDAGDARIFFGREEALEQLERQVRAHALVLLMGASGAGKTSLIRAGLVPSVRRSGGEVLYARVYDDPLAALREGASALETGGERWSASPHEDLPERLAAAASRTPLFVLVLDQLEELFVRFDRSERLRIAATLQACLDRARGTLRIVLSFREDYLHRFHELREALPTLFHNVFQLAPLSRAQARAAIEGPARAFGLELEEALLDRLLSDLEQDSIEPPQLQLVCDSLYDALPPGGTRMTLAQYDAFGGASGILSRYLERALLTLPLEARAPVRDLLMTLVSSERTRAVCRLEDLAGRLRRPVLELEALVDCLIDLRVVRRTLREDELWLELSHEYLVGEIGSWLSEAHREAQRLRELLEQGMRTYRKHGLYLPADQLRLIDRRAPPLLLTPGEEAFLSSSRRRLQRRRRRVAAVVIALLMAVGLLAVAGRYATLRSSRFVRAQPRVFKALRAGRVETLQAEPLVIFRGLPAPNLLDRLLGFPKQQYETDFTTEQLEPGARDGVQAGASLAEGVSSVDRIVPLLTPEARLMHLVVTEQRAEGAALANELLTRPEGTVAPIETLLPVLGLSGYDDAAMVRAVLEHARKAELGRGNEAAPLSFEALDVAPYALLLSLVPADRWVGEVKGWIDDRNLRNLALSLLVAGVDTAGSTGLPESMLRDGLSSAKAFRLLVDTDSCAALAQVRRLLFAVPILPASSYADGIELIGQCGGASDVAPLEALAVRLASETEFAAHRRAVLPAVFRALGRLEAPSPAQLLRRLGALGISPLELQLIAERGDRVQDPGLLEIMRTAVQSDDPEARVYASHQLAVRGDSTCLSQVWQGSVSSGEQNGFYHIWGLGMYEHPSIRRTLLAALQRPRLPAFVEAGIYAALGSDWSDESAAAVLNGLSRRDDYVVSYARHALSRLAFGGYHAQVVAILTSALNDRDPRVRLNAAFVLQRLDGRPRAEAFLAFLEPGVTVGSMAARSAGDGEADDVSRDGVAYEVAVGGLRDAWTRTSVTEAVRALGSPSQAVRLAASLALAIHGDREGVDRALEPLVEGNDPELRSVALRARWAVSTTRVIQRERRRIDALLEAGRPHAALRHFQRIGEYEAALGRGLGAVSPSMVQDIGQQMILGARVYAALDELEIATTHLVQYPPETFPEQRVDFLSDPRFQRLRQLFAFRILFGLEPRPVPAQPLQP